MPDASPLAVALVALTDAATNTASYNCTFGEANSETDNGPDIDAHREADATAIAISNERSHRIADNGTDQGAKQPADKRSYNAPDKGSDFCTHTTYQVADIETYS